MLTSIVGCGSWLPYSSLFSPEARKLIAQHSEGIPRNVNNLCFNALSLGCALSRQTIDRSIIANVIADLDLEPLREKPVTPEKPAENQTSAPPAILSIGKDQSNFGRSALKIAVTGALLLALSLTAIYANRSRSQPAELSADIALTLPTAVESTLSGKASDSPRLTLNQRLSRATVAKLAPYGPELMGELRSLRSWFERSNRIRFGQTRATALTTGPGLVQRSSASDAGPGEQ